MGAPHNKLFTDKDVAQVLLNARALMNNKGKHWIKGKLRKNKPSIGMCYCSVGAIRAAAPGDGNKRLRAAAYKSLAKEISPSYSDTYDEYGKYAREVIITWNDGWCRTWQEINLKFRQVAASVKKGAKTK